MPVLGAAPSPAAFARAWRDTLGPAVTEAAGKDGRLSRSEAARMAERSDAGRFAADNALGYLTATGQQTVSAAKLIGIVEAYAEREGAAIAGPNQRISLLEARLLPQDLREDFFSLRGKIADPPALEGDALKNAVRGQVLASLDDGTATKLPGPPWVVRGRQPLLTDLPHAASNTRVSRVVIAEGEVYFSRAASFPTPLVGWYRAGPVPTP